MAILLIVLPSSLAKSLTHTDLKKQNMMRRRTILITTIFEPLNLVKMDPIFVSSTLLHFRKKLLQIWSLFGKKVSDKPRRSWLIKSSLVKHMYFEKYTVYLININPSQPQTYSKSR